MKLCTKNHENPSVVKATAKNQWHLFSGHGVNALSDGVRVPVCDVVTNKFTKLQTKKLYTGDQKQTPRQLLLPGQGHEIENRITSFSSVNHQTSAYSTVQSVISSPT